MGRVQLKGLALPELERFVNRCGESRYRARQLFTWMYKKKAVSFAEMTDISATFRAYLAKNATLQALSLQQVQQTKAGETRKYLFALQDGFRVESVLMREGDRRTLCISTQVGCPIDCKFCATGAMGLKRNLQTGEIIDQVLQAERESGERVTNIVVMGMGEPMLNYENMMAALDILTDERGLDLAKRHVVVSTSGLVPAIRRFSEEKRKYRLAISLNATTDAVRSQIMPLNKKWPISELLAAARDYTRAARQLVTFEYVLLDGVNDATADAQRLQQLLRGMRCKVNLIPYNATHRGFRRPSAERVEAFYAALASLHAPVTIRWSKGTDIDAACGQLLTQVVGDEARQGAADTRAEK